VVEALKATLPLDYDALDKTVDDRSHWMWAQWDTDGSGFIEQRELLAEQGLAAYVRQAFVAHGGRGPIPDIRSDKSGWFTYWDEDGNGSLDKEEVVRALLKTLRLGSEPSKVTALRGTVDAIWPVFDSDGSGAIDRSELLLPGEGLADTIIATM
jgi:hypothetical protein